MRRRNKTVGRKASAASRVPLWDPFDLCPSEFYRWRRLRRTATFWIRIAGVALVLATLACGVQWVRYRRQARQRQAMIDAYVPAAELRQKLGRVRKRIKDAETIARSFESETAEVWDAAAVTGEVATMIRGGDARVMRLAVRRRTDSGDGTGEPESSSRLSFGSTFGGSFEISIAGSVADADRLAAAMEGDDRVATVRRFGAGMLRGQLTDGRWATPGTAVRADRAGRGRR